MHEGVQSKERTCKMLRLLLCILGVAVLVSAEPAEFDDAANLTRVVGGQPAYDGQFPHQVSLRLSNRHFCGGSVIGPRKILTAAHCIQGISNIYSMTAVVGTNSLSSGGTAYQVTDAVYHHGFDSNSLINDIGVITVDRPISFNSRVKSIPLARGSTSPNTDLVLSGWGLTRYPGTLPNNLQYIRLKSLDLQTCSSQLQGTNGIYSTNVCTAAFPGRGACRGDSGGPLISSSGVQVGVVSWGVPCAIGRPDVFTNVASFTSWIDQQ